MYRTVFAAAALLPLLVLTLVSRGQSCPRSCNCYQANEVHCTFRSLVIIPPGLPAHTRRINLGFNSIRRLQEKSLAGLKRVELLMLHSNELHHLPDAVFRDMKSLQILKLSYNKLREISSSMTFSGLASLLRLYLDHNLLQHIHPRALLQLPSLRLLRLQGNRLHQLHPHALCTLSLLNTYYFSTLRHVDLSNNSLTTLPQESVVTAPQLETLNLQANPWSCDCRMNWFLSWSLAHPGLMKCPGGPQCPVCASPTSLQGQGLLDQIALKCTSPVIDLPQKENLLDTDLSEIQSTAAFREPLGSVSLGLSDQQGNSIDLTCNITHSTDSQDITPPPDLSWTSSSPLHLALSLSLECPIKAENYEKLWRMLAYYSETAARFEREIMLSKAPALAYRYRQAQESDGYYHSGVKASVKARPQWLLQSAISLQLNRAQSSGHKVQLIYSTRVSAQPDATSPLSTSSSASHQWVMISTNRTAAALAVVAGRKIELTCPLLSSGKPSVYWILPDGSKLNSPSSGLNGRLQASASDLLIQKALLSDAGIYYCVAKAGKDVDVLPLRLAVEDSSAPYSAEISGPPVTGKVGEAVTLSCKISGSPQPSMNWILPDGNVVWQGLGVARGLTIDLNGTLSLRKSSLRDAGYYRCIAVNQHGSDSRSFRLIINPQRISSLETSFPRGPQSASGRSTKIRAPVFHQLDEGSGDEEGHKQTKASINKNRLSMPRPNRRYPVGKPQRRGRVKEDPSRRGGRPVSPTEQRRNLFQSRQRITTNKLRMDPKSWAEILAKIRQKAANATHVHPISRENTTAESIQEENDKGTKGQGEGDGMSGGRAEGTGIEAETEGSSVDEAILREDQSQPIRPAHGDIQTTAGARINAETENGAEATETYINPTTETKTIQKENESTQTTAINPAIQEELVTSNPFPGTNKSAPEPKKVPKEGLNLNPAITRPQNPKQGFLHNLVPSSRPQSPWNVRRKIGQRRRIKKPRIWPVTSPQPLPVPVTPVSTVDVISTSLPEPTASHPAALLTTCDHIKNAANNVALKALPTPFSDISTSNFTLPSLAPSPAHTDTYADVMSHSGKTPQTQDSTFNGTSTPTHPNVVISETHAPGTHNKAFTHGAQTHTERQTTLNNRVETLPSGEALGMNELDESHFSRTHPFIASLIPSVPSAAATIITMPPAAPERAGYAGSTGSASTSTTSEDTLPTKTSAISPTVSPSTTAVIPVSSTTQETSTTSTSTTTTTSSARTSTTTAIPVVDTFSITSGPSTSTSSVTFSMKDIAETSNPVSAVSRSNPTTTKRISTKTSHATTRQPNADDLWSTTTEMGLTVTKTSSKRMPVTVHVDPRGRAFPGTPNKSPTSSDWKNSGFNFIPDSHSRRFQQPPSSSLPAAPGAPAVRSGPRIVVPHSRTVSFPANSTATLTCDAQGDPKPSITWTKVATGAVMSIHSRAQRFEVLPNGTFVIQNVQLQDRGTYVCSATSYLGRDRLLVSLDVWTRPPRLRLASYREITVHQGGDVHLECQADGAPTPLLSWVLPDRSSLTSSSNSSGRVTVDTNGTLQIPVTLPSDRGLYRCVASNSAGAASSTVRVHVSSLPPVIQQPREEHLLFSPGRPVYAHCSARGAPPPTLRWRIPDGTQVRPSQFLHGNLFVLPNGTLHILKVGPKDAGSYECTASNAVGTYKRTVKVEVEEGAGLEKHEEARIEEVKDKKTPNSSLFNTNRAPVIPSQPTYPSTNISPVHPSDKSRNLSISPSSSNSSSNSAPEINKTVKASHFADIKKTNPPTVFSQSAVPAHNTNVSPRINNTRATSSPADRKASSVLQPLPVSPFTKARIVSTSPSASTVNYGGILKLYCSVTGNPTPVIIWRTPNRKLVDTHYSYDRRLKAYQNGTLSIQAVTEKDAGEYLCITRNKVADDFRLLRVNVATRPAKIEPKQPPNHTVSLGKPLKMDCQASGLPHPAVRWRLPDGTMVNTVLQEEDNRGRPRQLTLFDNGTLLVPSVGMGEEGEYMCYAENQAGLDTMKVKVKVLRTSPPTFTDEKSLHFIKLRQGASAMIPCQARGDPAPTVTWFSPARRVIPQRLGSGYYSERIVAVSDGTLKVRLAQNIDAGNYTCQASNSAGMRSKVVTLEVETSARGLNEQVGGGRSWNINSERVGSHDSRSGDNVVNIGVIRHGVTSVLASRDSYSDNNNNGRIRNVLPNTGVNLVVGGSSYSQNGFKSPLSGFTTQLGNTGIAAGVNGAQSAESIEISRTKPTSVSRSNSLGHNRNTDTRNISERNPGTNNNEVSTAQTSDRANNSRHIGTLGGVSGNVQSLSSGLSNSEAGTNTIRGRSFSGSSNLGGTSDSRGTRGGLSGSSDAALGVVTTIKQQALKDQTVLLPCPSQGSPPPRLSWLLPGNGMLPAPYYGSRLTVHRNGSLELRGVRTSDSGILVCVVKSERGEMLIRVELEVSEQQADARFPQRGVAEKRSQQEDVSNPAQPLIPGSPLLHQQKIQSSAGVARPVTSLPSISSAFESKVSTKMTPLVSTINGETFRLPCPASQTQASLLWTLPGGKVLSRGESGDSGRYTVHEDGTLVIKQASVFDRGTYSCKFSSHDSASFSVLTVPVIVIAYPPRITAGPSPVTYTRQGVAVELPCLTIATPRATVTWEAPDLTQLRVMGQPRIYGNRYLSPQGSLVIQNPTHRDTGFYRCTAKNVIGVDSKATYLHVI